ncbi:hypothetical protein C0995_004198, partial [Termitomyces sp. Mi166
MTPPPADQAASLTAKEVAEIHNSHTQLHTCNRITLGSCYHFGQLIILIKLLKLSQGHIKYAGASPAPQAGETPEASVYKPLPKQDDSDPRNVSASFGMPGGLSISWMKSILNPGAWPEERTFALGALPSLLYLELPEHIGQWRRSLDSLPQFGEMEVAGNDQLLMHTTQFQTINPNWMGRDDNDAREVEQAPSAPPAGSNQEKNGQKPLMRHKSLPGVLVEEPDRESSDEEEYGRLRLTLSVQLWLVLDHFPTVTKELTQKHLQLYMLELNEYIKHKAARGTALSTATLAESVDYDAIRRQQVPVIAEAMDMLNAPQQANESQQDFKRRQNAAHQQATASGVPLQALSEVEMATSKIVDEEEFEILQLPRMPRVVSQSKR